MIDEQALNGKSLQGYLIDMSDDEFRIMLAQVNMTALLNIQQTLLIAYTHIVRVKDAIIQAIINKQGEVPADSCIAVTKLHAILLKAEARYLQVSETLKHRDIGTENAYKELRKRGF